MFPNKTWAVIQGCTERRYDMLMSCENG